MGRKKHTDDGLQSKVFPTEFERDDRGKFYWFCNALNNLSVNIQGKPYAPTCNYSIHQGLVEDISICNKRHCGMLRLVKLKQYNPKPRCNSLFKVHTKKEKRYVNRSR